MAHRSAGHTGAEDGQRGEAPTEGRPPELAFLPVVLAFPFAGPELHSVRTELLGYATLLCCDDPVQLLQVVADVAPEMVLAGVRDRAGADTASIVARLHRAFPHVPIVAYCELTYADARGAIAAGNVGVRDVLVRGYDSARAMLSRVTAEASRRDLVDLVLTELGPLATGPLGWLVHHCLVHGGTHIAVKDAARAKGVSCSTLRDELRRHGLASPARIISWCRLLIAASELESPSRTVSRVARELGFTNGSELRMMFKRYTGLRPSEIRERGGVGFVARSFRTGLRTRRGPVRA